MCTRHFFRVEHGLADSGKPHRPPGKDGIPVRIPSIIPVYRLNHSSPRTGFIQAVFRSDSGETPGIPPESPRKGGGKAFGAARKIPCLCPCEFPMATATATLSALWRRGRRRSAAGTRRACQRGGGVVRRRERFPPPRRGEKKTRRRRLGTDDDCQPIGARESPCGKLFPGNEPL